MKRLLITLSCLLGAAGQAQEANPVAEIVAKVSAFAGTLNPAQSGKFFHAFNSDERLNWHYFPKVRGGIPLKELEPAQREQAMDVLRAALSAEGFLKVETIRSLEEVLFELEGRPDRDHDLYYVACFGEPAVDTVWGLRYEGHHLSINLTMMDGKVIASTPQFLGANPAEVLEGPKKGTRALAVEEDLARKLVKSLTPEQRTLGVLSADAPPEILTGADREAAIQENLGIAYDQLNAEQQGMLITLIEEYAKTQRPEVAGERLAKVRASGLDAVKFAWMGGLERGEGHYYRIQGSTFLIEYDNTQNNANHIHTVWRDFKGDFGLDLLKEHYAQHAHASQPAAHDH